MVAGSDGWCHLLDGAVGVNVRLGQKGMSDAIVKLMGGESARIWWVLSHESVDGVLRVWEGHLSGHTMWE